MNIKFKYEIEVANGEGLPVKLKLESSKNTPELAYLEYCQKEQVTPGEITDYWYLTKEEMPMEVKDDCDCPLCRAGVAEKIKAAIKERMENRSQREFDGIIVDCSPTAEELAKTLERIRETRKAKKD